LDTETSGLAGGTGTYVFLVGIGFRIEHGFKLAQIFMRDPSQEPALLAAITQILDSFDTIVTFNGRTFDVPLLNTRHVLNGFTSPFSAMSHVDLLPLARRLWRNRLPSRALSSLEIEILGLQRTREEVPGWMIPEIYFDYLRNGDARQLEGVFYHNAMDIVSLAALFNYMADMLEGPLGNPLLPGLDLVALARLYEDLQDWETAILLYERGLDQGLPQDFFIQTLERFAQLYRRQENWEGAVNLWKKAAGHKHLDAYIELAKYYEHQQRDYDQAIQWTQNALELVPQIETNLFIRKSLSGDFQKRLDRLMKKKGISDA
jgi:tetratricopeptide (TPR) repeat protein